MAKKYKILGRVDIDEIVLKRRYNFLVNESGLIYLNK